MVKSKGICDFKLMQYKGLFFLLFPLSFAFGQSPQAPHAMPDPSGLSTLAAVSYLHTHEQFEGELKRYGWNPFERDWAITNQTQVVLIKQAYLPRYLNLLSRLNQTAMPPAPLDRARIIYHGCVQGLCRYLQFLVQPSPRPGATAAAEKEFEACRRAYLSHRELITRLKENLR